MIRDNLGRFVKGNKGYWKGKKFTKKHRNNIGKSAKGRTSSNKGKKLSGGLLRKARTAFLGKHHSKKTREKMSIARRGKNHWNWQGGITSLRNRVTKILQYKIWRSNIFERDNWTCQTCRKRSQKGIKIYLEAHHIKSIYKILKEYNLKTIKDCINCKELWDLTNGQTLCKKCHDKTKGRIKVK